MTYQPPPILPPPAGEVFDFPAQMQVRVIGAQRDGFESAVAETAAAFASLEPDATSVNPSRDGNFVSVVLSLTVADRPQFDALFAALKQVEGVRLVL